MTSPVIAKLSDVLKKAYVVESSGNLMTPAGRIMYGSFFTTVAPSKNERDPKKKQWGTTLLLPAVADLTALEAEIDRIVSDNLTESKRAPLKDGTLPYNYPILKTAKINSLASYADEYPFCIRPNTKEFTRDGRPRPAPQVLDAKGREVSNEDEADQIYNGRWARLTLNPYWYPANEGKAGVSLGLVNVQLLYNDDPLAGGKARAESEFAAVDIDEDEDVNEDVYA